MPYTNRDLLFWKPSIPRTDELFVVTEPPSLLTGSSASRNVAIRVNLAACAAVLDTRSNAYPQQPTVGQIRQGQQTGWLLSGGCLITNQHNHIAVGLRDGNAADRFVYTNIGAGRCDQKLREHCLEERDSEFILCVKERGAWHQILWGPQTRSVHQLDKADIASLLSAIVPNIKTTKPPPVAHNSLKTDLAGNITLEWYDDTDGTCLTEQLPGYIFVDHAVHTTEFRLAMQYDLSDYDEVRIFFGEGTGYAEWQPLEQIRLFARAESITGRRFITSFLRHL